jgi:hypothetical protein
MKIGEIWKYKFGIDELIDSDRYCYEPGDELVEILSLSSRHDMEVIEFVHLQSKAIGVMDRRDFLVLYEKEWSNDTVSFI